MSCIERLSFEEEYLERRRESIAENIMILSMVENTMYAIHELSIVKSVQDRIKEVIRSAYRLGWIAMSELNDTTVLYGLDKKQILELLG